MMLKTSLISFPLAAVISKANFLTTFNTKDFVGAETKGVKVLHPDQLLCELHHLYPEDVMESIEQQLSRLQRPTKSLQQLVEGLRKVHITNFAKLLERNINAKTL